MGNNWLFFIEPDSANIFPIDPLVPHNFGGHFLSHITSFGDNSRYLYVPGSLALQEAFNCVSKFAGAVFLWFASGSNSNINHKVPGSRSGSDSSSQTYGQALHVYSSRGSIVRSFWNSRCEGKPTIPVVFGKISRFALKQLCKEAERLQSLPALSLAAALIPPFNNVSSNVLAGPLEAASVETQRSLYQRPCEVEHGQCGPSKNLQNFAWSRSTVEPKTGIEFPALLDRDVDEENNSSSTPEVLVGTGSRTMTIIRIKSLKVYAFGFYIHPIDVCEKLGSKYAWIPESELNNGQDFYRDLLREDISMTVRLVVNCNGIKINSVKDTFEKSLRARLLKTNPEADFRCLEQFGSLFSQDIPLHVGTTINFRRTADGHLITEVGGRCLGAVRSTDLCKAFFGMYIGDVPVCEQTKKQIGENVASIIRMC